MTPSFFETWQQLQPVESWDTKQGVVHTASKGSLSAGEVITLTILVHE